MGLSRSEQMARIRGRDTAPEKLLRKQLWSRGIRYRLNYRLPVGRPDLTFPGKRLAVFIDGCFWHGCPDHYVRPRTRTEFWSAKLRENVERDIRQTAELEKLDWRVVRFWEHEIFTELESAARLVEHLVEMQDNESLPRRPQPRVVHAEQLKGESDLERWTLVDLSDKDWLSTIDKLRSTRKW